MIYVNNDTESITIPNLLGIDVRRVRGTVINNVTNDTVIGYGTNSSENPAYLTFVFQVGWLNQFPNNEYTVSIDAYDTLNEDWIFIGKFLVQKGIADASISSFESNQEYISFEP